MRFSFSAEQFLPYRHELVFAFFANPENLPRLMPRWQAARIEEATFAAVPPRPAGAPVYPGIAAGSGTRLTISIKPFPFAPFRLPWEALIEDFRWNHGFCDLQERGPFRYWRHCHTVSATTAELGCNAQIGTILRDHVDYELPLPDFIAPLINKLFLAPQLRRTFAFRQRRTTELLALATKR